MNGIRYAALLAGVSSALAGVCACECSAEPSPSRVQHEFPRVGKYEVINGDFHLHTVKSDGKVSARDRMLEAWRYGYDVVALTDHGNNQAYDEALSLADALGLILIRGYETGVGGKEHLVALGVPADYKPRKAHFLDENDGPDAVYYRDELTQLHKLGACVTYAHPHVGYREPVTWGVEQGLIQAIEVKNQVVGSGWNTTNSHGTWCYPAALTFGSENNLAIMADSDAHEARDAYGGVKARPVTLVFAKDRTDKGVLEAIKDRRTVAWFDGMLWGRESLLKDLVNALVEVKGGSEPDGTAWVVMRNRGPVALNALIGGSVGKVSVPPYESAVIKLPATSESLAVRWTNVWTLPDTNLVSSYDL